MASSAPSRAASYYITNRCVACGTCTRVCREGCISGGAPPFKIRQPYCTRCGLCAAKCPMKAIIRQEA